jgi:polysaccharide export outer membrane protein
MAFMAQIRSGKAWVCLMAMTALSGCASLPISGPTGHQVEMGAQDGKKPVEVPFRLVDVDRMAALPPVASAPLSQAQDTLPPPSDLIGPGDVLDIQIYEAGVALFAGSRASVTGVAPSGAAQVEHLPLIRVDDKGEIALPFAGRLRAGGHTSTELAAMIRRALKGLSQDPQIMVNIAQSITNSVIVGGEVARPGRMTLSTNRESLADVIALAGGWRGEAKDIAVQITRGPRRIEYRLSEVMAGADHEFRIQPTDRIELLKKPQTFAVLGAAGRVEQLPFSAPAISLAEALAMSGGANPNLGDAKAIFVFRYDRVDGKDTPVVYHFNLMNPGNFFLAQRFMMRDKDVLYVGNAAANQPTKMIQLVSQLFAPVVAVESVLVNTGTFP